MVADELDCEHVLAMPVHCLRWEAVDAGVEAIIPKEIVNDALDGRGTVDLACDEAQLVKGGDFGEGLFLVDGNRHGVVLHLN